MKSVRCLATFRHIILLLPLTGLACASAAAAPITLRVMAWEPTGEHLLLGTPDLLNAFHQANPNLRVNLDEQDWSRAYPQIKYWCGSLRDYAPDMIVMRDQWLPEFVNSLLPLDGDFRPIELAGFLPSVLSRCRVNGKLVGIPWRLQSRVLYYRSDLLSAAKLKPPQTLADLKQAAKALSKPPERYGLGLPARPEEGAVDAFLGLLWAYGGKAVDAKGELALPSKEGSAALQYWYDLQQAGALEPEGLTWGSTELEEAFCAGRLGMVFSGPSLARYLRRRNPKLAFGICPLPRGTATVAQISCNVLVVLKSTRHPRECVRFIKFMSQSPAQRAMWAMGSVPTYVGQETEAGQSPDLAPFVAHLDVARGMPLMLADEVSAVVGRALWLVLSGRASSQVALSQAYAETTQGKP